MSRGGTPLYKPYRYVPPRRIYYIFFSRFGLKTGLHFAHLGLESGIVFDGTKPTGVYERGDEWSLRAFASMPSTAIFLASTSRNKKIALQACEQRKNLGSTSKRALVQILRANRGKVKFCEQLKFLMDHSSPLMNVFVISVPKWILRKEE